MPLQDLALRFFASQALVWGPMFLGHQLLRRGAAVESWARPLHSVVVVFLVPLITVLGVWRLDRAGSDWWRVPLLYGLMLAASGVIAFIISPRLFRDRRSIATHILLVTISNIGNTMAGFLTLLLLGAAAYPFNAILMLPSCIMIFLLWLPAATHYAHGSGALFGPSYWKLVLSPLSMPLVGVFIGLALNFSSFEITEPLERLMQILVYATTALTMFAIGCRLRLRHAWKLARALRWLHVIKFVAHPAIIVLLCLLFGVKGMAAGVLLIAAIMPAGVMPIQFSTIQNLDVDLANAGFLVSTIVFMLVVLPVLLFLLQLPMFS